MTDVLYRVYTRLEWTCLILQQKETARYRILAQKHNNNQKYSAARADPIASPADTSPYPRGGLPPRGDGMPRSRAVLEPQDLDPLVPGHPGLGVRPPRGLVACDVIIHQQHGHLLRQPGDVHRPLE